jgi:GDP-4-dehydro-6-deoxy-D-mannose reductase
LSNKNTLIVTGADGFIGKALLKQADGLMNIESLKKEDGDLESLDIHKHLCIKVENPRFVHLASRTFVPNAWKSPEGFIHSNISSTLNVLKYCRNMKIPLIYISAYIYGNQSSLPIREDAKINPSNPYAHSKYLCEEMCKYFSKVFDMDITILRPFNIYGPSQKDSFLIPEIIQQLKKSNTVRVNSFNPKRDYLYIDDLIEAIIIASKETTGLQIYNLGSGKSISVKDLINLIGKIIGKDIESFENNIERLNEIEDVIADVSLAKKNLGWQPNINLEEGLKEILVHEGFIL